MSKDKTVWLVIDTVLVTAAVSMLCFVLWGLNRGFGMMVEGYYLLAYQDPQLYPTFSSFHLLLSKLPKLCPSTVCHYRLLELILRLVGASVLCAGFARWINQLTAKMDEIAPRVCMFASTIVGALLVFSCFPQTISYNGLSAFFIFTCTGMIFFVLSNCLRAELKTGAAAIVLFASGLLAGLSFFAKFSSGVVFMLLTLLLLLSYAKTLRTFLIASYIAGCACAFTAYFALVEPFSVWQSNFSNALRQETMGGSHGVGDVLAGFFDPLLRHVEHLPLLIIAAAAFYFFASFLRRLNQSRYSGTVAGVSAVVITALIWALIRIKYSHFHESNFPCFVLLAETILLIVVVKDTAPTLATASTGKWRERPVVALIADERWRHLLAGLLFVVILPLVASFGTNTGVWEHAASNMAPWFMLIGTFAALIAASYGSALFAAYLMVPLSVYAFFQFVDGYVYNRYDMDDSLIAQTESVALPRLQGVTVDKPMKAFLEESDRLLREHGYKNGDIILSFYDRPGLVYAVEARSFGLAWFVPWHDRQDINAESLIGLKSLKPERLFVVLDENDTHKMLSMKILNSLSNEGLAFPDDFERIGELHDPNDAEVLVGFYAKRAAAQ